jgi:hypothetical protein
MPAKILYTKTKPKTGGFPHLKMAKNAVCHSKVLNKIYHKIFFDKYNNFKFFDTEGIVESDLLKVLGVIYAPSHPD